MYNFDEISNRCNVNSLKWENDDVIPMWVADMDFDTLTDIKDAIRKRLDIGALGYTNTPKEYYLAFHDFWLRNHDIDLDISNMIFSTGVVPAISSIVRKLNNKGDKITILTPTYNIFFNSIINNGLIPLESKLEFINREYKINYIDLENKLKESKMLILCNPLNPVGKIWDKDELIKIGNLCLKYNVIILSDEIHCDIITPGLKYIPLLSLKEFNDITITCISASKCFNLAGLQGALVVVPNLDLKKKVERGLNTDEVAEGNVFVYDAFISALNNGDLWLKEMNEYVYNNKLYLKEFINKNLPELDYHYGDATYLAWVDVSKITDDGFELCEYLKNKHKVYFSYGEEYGHDFKAFIRINLATSKKILIEGLNRLLKGIKEYKK